MKFVLVVFLLSVCRGFFTAQQIRELPHVMDPHVGFYIKMITDFIKENKHKKWVVYPERYEPLSFPAKEDPPLEEISYELKRLGYHTKLIKRAWWDIFSVKERLKISWGGNNK